MSSKGQMKIKQKRKIIYALATLLSVSVIAGCSASSGISAIHEKLESPKQWHSPKLNSLETPRENAASVQDNKVTQQWLLTFNDNALNQLVQLALNHNRQLKVEQTNLLLAEQRAIVAGVMQFPELSLTQGNARRRVISNDEAQYTTNADIILQLSYELDYLGKLSDKQHQAALEYESAKNQFQQHQINLIANVTKSWFNFIEAKQLLNLYQERANNLKNNLEMIQSSYRLGLNQALDVYLTQNDVSRELARVAEQQQMLLVRKRSLELLIGQYPQGTLDDNQSLPTLTTDIDVGLPSDLLTQRADIVASWYQLLALDAGLAVAHKQRFPKISLTASTGDSSDELANLLDGSRLAWSLIGNITMPLFDAGRLASLEEQARLAVVKYEQQYIDLVFNAFADVENAISNNTALKQRYLHFEQAAENAKAAETISFDKYIRGLVSYTTVLESQRRAFDAQTSLISLSNQLLQNRVALHQALGGSAFVEDTAALDLEISSEHNTVSE